MTKIYYRQQILGFFKKRLNVQVIRLSQKYVGTQDITHYPTFEPSANFLGNSPDKVSYLRNYDVALFVIFFSWEAEKEYRWVCKYWYFWNLVNHDELNREKIHVAFFVFLKLLLIVHI